MDTSFYEGALRWTGSTVLAPAAGRVDGDDLGALYLSAPMRKIFHIFGGEMGKVAATRQGDGMVAFARAANINPHHVNRRMINPIFHSFAEESSS